MTPPRQETGPAADGLLAPGDPRRADHVLVTAGSSPDALDQAIADLDDTLAADGAWRLDDPRENRFRLGRRIVVAELRLVPTAVRIRPPGRPLESISVATCGVRDLAQGDDPRAALLHARTLLADARARSRDTLATAEAARAATTWSLAAAALARPGDGARVDQVGLPAPTRSGGLGSGGLLLPDSDPGVALLARAPTFLTLHCSIETAAPPIEPWPQATLVKGWEAVPRGSATDPDADPIATMRALAETAA